MLTKDEETTRVLITREFINYVILLIVRALVPAAKESNISELGEHPRAPMHIHINDIFSFVGDLKRLIQLFGKNAGHVLTEADVNGDDDFTSSVREVWHRAHDDLRALSASVWPQREPVLSWWTDFGRQFGVDVDAPYEPAGEGAYKHPGPILKFKGKGCRWKECLCFGERPHHKLRKCKRCLKVLYCSTKCQKRCVIYVVFLRWLLRIDYGVGIGTKEDTNTCVAPPPANITAESWLLCCFHAVIYRAIDFCARCSEIKPSRVNSSLNGLRRDGSQLEGLHQESLLNHTYRQNVSFSVSISRQRHPWKSCRLHTIARGWR